MRTRMTLAASFVGVVAMAAAAFGQTGAPSGTGEEKTQNERRAGANERAGRDGCGPDHAGRRAARLVHSETKVKTPQGFALFTIDHGVVTSIDHSAKKMTIKRSDGEHVTATAVDETQVCKDGKKAAFDSIKVGDHARLVSVRSERFTGLRRIVVITPGSEPAAPDRAPKRDAAPEGSSDQKAG
ncbi:MAG: hypothetical protein ACRDKS_04145 [Actinomycetota bacterium]